MTVGAAEPLGGYDIARRDLPWRNAVVRAGLMPTLGRPSAAASCVGWKSHARCTTASAPRK